MSESTDRFGCHDNNLTVTATERKLLFINNARIARKRLHKHNLALLSHNMLTSHFTSESLDAFHAGSG